MSIQKSNDKFHLMTTCSVILLKESFMGYDFYFFFIWCSNTYFWVYYFQNVVFAVTDIVLRLNHLNVARRSWNVTEDLVSLKVSIRIKKIPSLLFVQNWYVWSMHFYMEWLSESLKFIPWLNVVLKYHADNAHVCILAISFTSHL